MGDGVCVQERSRPRWLRKPPESASGGLGLIRRGAEAPRRFCAGSVLVGAVLGKCRLHWGCLAGCEDSLGTPREGCEKSGTPLVSVAEVEARSLGGRGLR